MNQPVPRRNSTAAGTLAAAAPAGPVIDNLTTPLRA